MIVENVVVTHQATKNGTQSFEPLRMPIAARAAAVNGMSRHTVRGPNQKT